MFLVDLFAPGKRAQYQLMGDINGDGKIDNSDVALFLQVYQTRSYPDWWDGYGTCDLNGDGKVDSSDLVILLQNLRANPDIYGWLGWGGQGAVEWAIVGVGSAGAVLMFGLGLLTGAYLPKAKPA